MNPEVTVADDDRAWNLLLKNLADFQSENSRQHNEIVRLLRAQNGRIKTLELWRARIVGIALGGSAVVSIIVKVLWK